LQTLGVYDDWPHGRGIFINNDHSDGVLVVRVGGEDILQIIAMHESSDVNAVWNLFNKGLCTVHKGLRALGHEFEFDKHLGYISSCPSNLGTGIRTSFNVDLPSSKTKTELENLAEHHELNISACSDAQLGDAKFVTYEISNIYCLGSDAATQIQTVVDGVNELLSSEKEMKEGDMIQIIENRIKETNRLLMNENQEDDRIEEFEEGDEKSAHEDQKAGEERSETELLERYHSETKTRQSESEEESEEISPLNIYSETDLESRQLRKGVSEDLTPLVLEEREGFKKRDSEEDLDVFDEVDPFLEIVGKMVDLINSDPENEDAILRKLIGEFPARGRALHRLSARDHRLHTSEVSTYFTMPNGEEDLESIQKLYEAILKLQMEL